MILDETKKKIIKGLMELALENPTRDSFKMTEIASKVGLTRATIYRYHFRNEKEIITQAEKMIQQEIDQAFAGYFAVGGESPLEFFAERVLPILYKHQYFMYVFCSTSIDTGWIRVLEQSYYPFLERALEKSSAFVKNSKGIVIKMLIYQIIGIISAWFQQEKIESLEVFQVKFRVLIDLPLGEYLK
jgi:AcrR family transcriptional regulator